MAKKKMTKEYYEEHKKEIERKVINGKPYLECIIFIPLAIGIIIGIIKELFL